MYCCEHPKTHGQTRVFCTFPLLVFICPLELFRLRFPFGAFQFRLSIWRSFPNRVPLLILSLRIRRCTFKFTSILSRHALIIFHVSGDAILSTQRHVERSVEISFKSSFEHSFEVMFKTHSYTLYNKHWIISKRSLAISFASALKSTLTQY